MPTGVPAAKLLAAVGTLGIFAVESSMEQPDIIRYALTQGGLLAVVLVLAWSYRKDFTTALGIKEDRILVLTELVRGATEAQTKSAESMAAMARSVERMTETLAHLSLRP